MSSPNITNSTSSTVSTNPSITATQINYFFVCHRKLWLFSHQIQMEHNSELVAIGKLLHEESYKREKKEIQIGPIKIDFFDKRGVIHEVKKSPSVEDAHIWQLKYYIYYLKKLGVENLSGEINYPKLKKVLRVELTQDDCKELEKVLDDIERIISNETIPSIIDKKICKKCSYYELCYI